MSRLIEKRISRKKIFSKVFGIIILLTIFSSISATLIFLKEFNQTNIYENFLPIIIVNVNLIIIYIAIRRKRVTLNQNDIDIFIIVHDFQKEMNFSEREIYENLASLFSSHPKKEFEKLYSKYEHEEKTIYRSCKNLMVELPEVRYYTLYSLLDLASKDNLISIKEEEYIKEVSSLLRIPKQTYLYIKNLYVKKGIREERQIKDEQNHRIPVQSPLPYIAYKVLGITPNITKVQLKKVYRILAKKYHPDKFYGKNEDLIHIAEKKFQEMTQAYEIILNNIKKDQ